MVRVTVDLDVTANAKICWCDEFVVLVHVLVLVAAQEWASNNTTVLNIWLVNADAVVGQVERDDEAAVDVLWYAGVEAGVVAADLLVVVDTLEKVTLWLLGYQVVNVAEGINLTSETVIGWDLALSWLWCLWHLNAADGEVSIEVLGKELLGVWVNTEDHVGTSKSVNWLIGVDLVAGQVVVADKVQSWLVNVTLEWKSLSVQKLREGVTTVVRVVNLTDLNSVVGQEVMHDVGQVLT